MATTMKAAILHGREDIRIERVPVPEAAPGELIVRVEAALTCGTDLKVFRRGYHARMIVPPALFGHELAGTVVEAGEGVTDFAPGDRVVALNSAPCGQCFFCGRGQENLCDDLLFNNGAYAEFIRIPARIVAKNTLHVPGHVPLEHAALTEPLACAVHGFEDSNAHPGDTIAVIGGGPLGANDSACGCAGRLRNDRHCQTRWPGGGSAAVGRFPRGADYKHPQGDPRDARFD